MAVRVRQLEQKEKPAWVNTAAGFVSGFELKKCDSNVWLWNHGTATQKSAVRKDMFTKVAYTSWWAARRQMLDCVKDSSDGKKKEDALSSAYPHNKWSSFLLIL